MFYESVASPILGLFPSEETQHLVKTFLRLCESSGSIAKAPFQLFNGRPLKDPRLHVDLAGIKFENPVTVGAGWDKDGDLIRALCWMGFAGVEVGTVTENPQPGNPKPRQFVIGPGVVINWLGFNGPGMEVVAKNLEHYKNDPIVIGLNVGKNKEVTPEDAPEKHAVVVRRLAQYARYVTINLSSPNTPGLRSLLAKNHLAEIVRSVQDALKETNQADKPLFVKISPDMSIEDLDDVIEVCTSLGVTGITASNTTIREDLKVKYGERWRTQPGGLSGNDDAFRMMVNEQIRHIRKQAGSSLLIIGVGGVDSPQSALEKILAGASLVQVVAGIRGRGPAVAHKINSGLLAWIEKEGVKNLNELVGQESQYSGKFF